MMKIPKIKPLWDLAGKIAVWSLDVPHKIYKNIGLSAAALMMGALSVFYAVNPAAFSNPFKVHTAYAATVNHNLNKAGYSGNISVYASMLNNYPYGIESFNMETPPMIGGYFINSSLTGSAIINSTGYNIPYMPPSGSDTSNWYYFVGPLIQGQQTNYTLYTGTEDLDGDIVYFPSSSGMRVNASNSLDFGSNDFTIQIDGYFDPNNTGADNIIYENNTFRLQYSNGQLILSNGSGGIVSTQVATLGSYTLNNGTYSTVLNNTSNAIITMVVNPTSLVSTTNSTAITNTTSNNTLSNTKYYSTHLVQGNTTFIRETTIYTTILNATTLNTSIDGHTITRTGDVPIIFNNITTTVGGNGVTTLLLNDQSGNAKTLSAGLPMTVTTKTTQYGSTTSNNTVTTTGQTRMTDSAQSYAYWTENTTYYTTYTVNQINSTSINKGTITVSNNAGQVGNQIGIMYYNIPSNTYSANWAGGDKVLTVSRSGNSLTVSDGSTTLISVPLNVGDTVATDGIANWTFAQAGAMKYLRSLTIENNGSTVGSWEWNVGDTFTDKSGNNNTAYPSFRNSTILNNSWSTFSNYRAVENQITTTTTTTSSESQVTSGLVDTTTPDSDINKETDESKWSNIFLFGMFYGLAQDGGIPPSLFFIPLFGALAIIVFMVAYHFTRDVFVSGIAGNAVLGLGIAFSVLYTIPLIIGLIVMVVLLVKRKTVSL